MNFLVSARSLDITHLSSFIGVFQCITFVEMTGCPLPFNKIIETTCTDIPLFAHAGLHTLPIAGSEFLCHSWLMSNTLFSIVSMQR